MMWQTQKISITILTLLTSLSLMGKEQGNPPPQEDGTFVSGGDPTGILTCRDKDVVDAAYVASFHNIYSENTTVTLFVPQGETSGHSYSAPCFPNEDTKDFSIYCQVFVEKNNQYWVTLSAGQGKPFKATANKINDEKPVNLPDCVSQ